ncbi:MAG: septation protein A [Gammaproteobacteria bacterium]|nr:septation protein A [Gammaproteobacteria bacterium]
MKILTDFFPIILFFGAYQLYDIYVATAVAIVASFLQVIGEWLIHKKVPKMHLVTLLMLVVFGGLTLALRDPLFIKWKPTVINWLFGFCFLLSPLFIKQTLTEKLMSQTVTLPVLIWKRLNNAWGLFFLALGILNLYVAFNYEESVWVNFKLFGMMGLTMGFIIAQAFYMARHIQDEPQSNEES